MTKRKPAKLTENERSVEQYNSIIDQHLSVIADLKAENERLRNLLSISEQSVQNLLKTPEWTQITKLTADYRDLEAENGRLRVSSFVTAVPSEDYEKLKAEVERLEINDYKNLSMRIEIDKLNAKINRLVKAGDKMVLCIDGDYNYQMPCVQAWNAAKEGKPSV